MKWEEFKEKIYEINPDLRDFISCGKCTNSDWAKVENAEEEVLIPYCINYRRPIDITLNAKECESFNQK